MIKIVILICFFVLFSVNCFAYNKTPLEVDGYRIYYGKNKKIDWIDVYTVRSKINYDKVIFEDKSPIEEIYFNEYFDYWIIYKKNSVWRLYNLGDVWQMRLDLIEPDLVKQVIINVLIYKKK